LRQAELNAQFTDLEAYMALDRLIFWRRSFHWPVQGS
jgi:hypothetical protein